MRVLFVCTNNVTRSQMAEAFFSRLSSHQGASAGVRVSKGGWAGWTMKELADDLSGPEYVQFTLHMMAAEGFDLSGSVAKQLTREMAEDADLMVALCPRENLPDYLLHSEKLRFEAIRIARPLTYGSFVQVKNDVKLLVEKLVREMG